MHTNNDLSNKEENILTWLMYKYLPFWPLFVGLVILSLAGAWAYLRYATPVYEASATIIIKDENKGVDDSEIMESMNAFATNKIVENEIEVIRSRALMKQVVNELYLYAPVLEDKGIKASSAYTTSPIVIALKDSENAFNLTNLPDKIYFSFDSLKNEVKIDNKIYPLDEWVKSPYGVIKFSANGKQTGSAIHPLYFTITNLRAVTANLLNRLEVNSASKLSTVVNLKFKDPVPQRGEDVLNQLIYNYNKAAITDRDTLANNTLAFIEDRITHVERDLDELEKEIQQYKSTKNVVDLSEQGKLYLQNVGNNDRRIADINLQLAVLDKVEKYVLSKDKKEGIVPSTMGINDPVLSQLLQKLYESEIQYERLSKTTAENNPILVSVVDEIEKIRPDILENVQSQRVNLQASLENLNATSGKYNSALQTIPQKERELLEISRRKAIKSELFSFLLQKREETALSYAPTVSDSRVVDLAESSIAPVSPKSLFIYSIAIIVALGFGLAFVTAKEVLVSRILYRSEIEEYTKLSVIGELSLVNQTKKQLLNRQVDRFIAEQFRDLRVALGLYGTNAYKKKILITSSIEGEGKSFVSENLALSLASSGKKTVLINFDLRKAKASSIFGLSEQKGIAEYINGSAEPFDLIKVSRHNNLYVIPAGHASESTSDALLDVDLTNLFTYLENTFEYIVIDTPPIGVATDAYMLSKYTNAALFIARHNHTPKESIQLLDQNSQMGLFNNLYIVFNGVKERGFIKGKYGYGYGYGYNQHRKMSYHTS